MIEFGELFADLPTYANPGAIKVDGVIPAKVGYRGFPNFAERSTNALGSTAVGLFTAFSSTGSTNYAGDTTKLYQYDSSQAFNDKSKAGNYSNSTTENDRDFWSFTQFGNRVIATNYADPIQYFDETSSSLFTDLISTIHAKYLATVRDFVFAGYTKEIETAKTFDSSAISSNEITITAHGWATGDTVVYDRNSNTALTNLTDGSTYYVIKVDADTIKLATTAANAVAGTAITLSATGGSETHKLEKFTTNFQRVKWSALNDSSDWTASTATQSGYQDVVGTHGKIQAVVGGEDFATIFFERAIYRADYTGSPLIFTFNKVADNIGAFAPRSVASFGNMIFFLADDGFYKLTGGQQLEPIGNGKIDDFFYNDLLTNIDGITSAIDPNNSLVVWSYRGADATGGISLNNKLLVFNYAVNKWSTASVDLEYLATSAQEAFTLEALDAISSSVDTLPYSLDSYRWLDGQIGLAGFNSSHKFGKFSGTNVDATIDTKEFEGVEGKRSTLINCTPIVDVNGFTGTVTATPITRSSQADAVTVGTAVSERSNNGDCPLRSTSRYHRIRIIASGKFTTLSGVQIEARPEGRR